MQNGEFMLEANGIKHWVKIAGAEHGTLPLVAIHGGPGGHHWIFERTGGPMLEQFATVIYYEQRGCGRSEAPEDPAAYSMELLVEDLEALRQALGLGKIIPLGHSFGGELALEYALKYPQHVEKAILNGSTDSRLLERIRDLQVPVLVLTGLHDRNTGVEMARDIVVNLPQAKLVIFEESGHHIQMDEPERMGEVIRAYLQGE